MLQRPRPQRTPTGSAHPSFQADGRNDTLMDNSEHETLAAAQSHPATHHQIRSSTNLTQPSNSSPQSRINNTLPVTQTIKEGLIAREHDISEERNHKRLRMITAAGPHGNGQLPIPQVNSANASASSKHFTRRATSGLRNQVLPLTTHEEILTGAFGPLHTLQPVRQESSESYEELTKGADRRESLRSQMHAQPSKGSLAITNTQIIIQSNSNSTAITRSKATIQHSSGANANTRIQLAAPVSHGGGKQVRSRRESAGIWLKDGEKVDKYGTPFPYRATTQQDIVIGWNYNDVRGNPPGNLTQQEWFDAYVKANELIKAEVGSKKAQYWRENGVARFEAITALIARKRLPADYSTDRP